MVFIHISSDRLKAFLELEEPTQLAEIEARLQTESIVFGIDRDAIDRALAQGPDCDVVCIATGTSPSARTASRVELANDECLNSGALHEESGRMDFRQRGGVHSIRAGELIGTWIPGTDGVAGKGVDGSPIEAPAPQAPDQSRGVHVRAEAGNAGYLLLYAEIDGVVRMGPAGDVYVTDVFEVDNDVDLSCGHIDVTGSVHVTGTIRSGFRVHAKQDVDVEGAIENADVNAGHSLRVAAGILAGEEGLIRAQHLIQAKFTQNATLRCGGLVVLETDTNSTIEAATDISAKEGAGHLRGGFYLAGQSLVAKELGSAQGVRTRVQVGLDPEKLRELARVRQDLTASLGQSKKLQRERGVQNSKRVGRSLTREHADGIRRAMKAQRDLQKAVALLEKRQKEIEDSMTGAELPYVRIEGKLHPGVCIQIGDAHMTIEQTHPGGTFRRDPSTGQITAS